MSCHDAIGYAQQRIGGGIVRAGTAFGIIGLVAFLAAGCTAASSNSSPSSAVSAVGTWSIAADPQPTLTLESDGSLTGSDGCNGLAGQWSESGDRITFTGVASTLMGCPGINPWLSGLDSATIDGSTMIINDTTGNEIGRLVREG
jgi:heat shock protein HslJ